jgi:hypothetical protein
LERGGISLLTSSPGTVKGREPRPGAEVRMLTEKTCMGKLRPAAAAAARRNLLLVVSPLQRRHQLRRARVLPLHERSNLIMTRRDKSPATNGSPTPHFRLQCDNEIGDWR